MPKPKKETLCWTCQWASGKDNKCPWAKSFQPVPGWKATPTKIMQYTNMVNGVNKRYYNDSFIVHECPLYELMDELKRRIVENAGQVRSEKPKKTIDELLREKYKKERKDNGKEI